MTSLSQRRCKDTNKIRNNKPPATLSCYHKKYAGRKIQRINQYDERQQDKLSVHGSNKPEQNIAHKELKIDRSINVANLKNKQITSNSRTDSNLLVTRSLE